MTSISKHYSSLLKLYSETRYLVEVKKLHGLILKTLHYSNTLLFNNLITSYSKSNLPSYAYRVFLQIPCQNLFSWNAVLSSSAKSGHLSEMCNIFNSMPERDCISWNSVISGYASHGFPEKAVHTYKLMLRDGCSMQNRITFSTMLIISSAMVSFTLGIQVHCQGIKHGLGSHVFVGSPLVGMYSKAGLVYEAWLAFQEVKEKNLNVFVGSALVDMYSKCKNIRLAESIFKRMKVKNLVTWTAMLVGYGQNECYEEAIRSFLQLQRHGIEPDDFTIGSAISSCANIASLEEGAQLHCRAILLGLNSFITVSNALVTLYGKCGNINDSHRLFDEMITRDEVSWTALVSGYAQIGKAKETIELFERMMANNVKPDGVTFIGVLSACSRAAMVEEGYYYFNSMINDHQIVPVADHYTCMIDLLSRAGRLKEAEDFIKKMPCRLDAIGWATLLSSCRVHGNIEMAKWAAESLIELDPQNPASYLLLLNMHATNKNWEEVAQIRKAMRDKGVRKEPGCSWIKYNNKVHIFSADDQSHPDSEKIYAELEMLGLKMEKEGYRPNTSSVLHDVSESEKRFMLGHHSEKLAIAFGLIFLPNKFPIRVFKNLRVCIDCHSATKYISKITGREILVRDAVRFHKFNDGLCSCGDFW
ncbi:Putative pentatricopeptide repeat-containing protein [Dendrobium catenatum]|uniref:Pentatricopeptide repeat-containing protein n=1 Tax=Dendrobium catenatum TaxID=906689 RepID=A0A2I0WL90_9ASPA|nr:Putative pentatricopeptide repeat-containing protein [Dendrobium catenatum]